jgi:hypothetical protein
LGKLRIEVLNVFGEKPDDGNAKNPLKTEDEFDVDPGDAQFDAGQHVTADIHALALQPYRQILLRPVLFGAQPGNGPANGIPGKHAVAHFNFGTVPRHASPD